MTIGIQNHGEHITLIRIVKDSWLMSQLNDVHVNQRAQSPDLKVIQLWFSDFFQELFYVRLDPSHGSSFLKLRLHFRNILSYLFLKPRFTKVLLGAIILFCIYIPFLVYKVFKVVHDFIPHL